MVMNKETKYSKLMEAHKNNLKISNYNLDEKFKYFENDKLSESKTLLYEIQNKPDIFKKYKRGSIVKVRFGVNPGSEFSGDHYAIVLNKDDSIYNPVLNVIPITSVSNKYNINLGNIIYDENKVNNLKTLLKNETDLENIKEPKKILNYFDKRKNKTSKACIKHLNTISKLSIINPINKYDYTNKIVLSKNIMNKIDKLIINEYTEIKID